LSAADWNGGGWTRLGTFSEPIQTALAGLAGGLEAAGIAGPTRNVRRLRPEAGEIASTPEIEAHARTLLGGQPRLVRALWFDKPARRNWPVQWHQDKTIQVAERHELAGFGPWSMKGGIPHVEPPLEVLQRMATIRLHLDACTAANGPLRVIPATHHSKLSREEIEQRVAESDVVDVHTAQWEAVAMRPLLLHSSGRAAADGHRRVLHLEFATGDLPAPLVWRA
jgi:ectoine hydroxylase-related dioxygenase (phytanoyl-CoA dioxygenase family)